MCDVCCAAHAVESTRAGKVHRFTWNPRPAASRLANNPDAPPLSNAPDASADWPFVLVQAESDEEHFEGRGRWRFGFAEDALSPWYPTAYLSMAIDQLGVSWTWDWLDAELRALLLTRDQAGIEALLAQERM